MIELTEKNFQETIDESDLVLVDFYATWCGPCKMQADVLSKIQTSRANKYNIAKVNIDEAPTLATRFGIDAIPTIIVFKNGKEIHKTVGLSTEEEIISMLEDNK